MPATLFLQRGLLTSPYYSKNSILCLSPILQVAGFVLLVVAIMTEI